LADLRSYFVPFDLDTGAGTEFVIGVNLRLSASGGSIEALGQQTMASSIPVAIASNQSSLTVDTELPAAVTLGDNASNPTAPAVGAFGMLWDGATWDRFPGTSADGALVNLGANNDVTVTSGSIDVQGVDAHDAAITADPVTVGGRASTAIPTAVSADGDAVRAWFDRQGAQKVALVDDAGDSAMDGTNNALRVNIVAGAGSGGTASTDDAAFTAGSGLGTPAMGFATTDTVDSGDVGVLRMSVTRDLMVTLRDSAGDSAMDDTNDAVRVNVVAGSGGGVTHVDDAAFTPGTDDGVPAFAMFDDVTPDSVNEGDAGILRMSANRNLYSTIRDAAGNERGVNVNANNAAAVYLPGTFALSDNFANPLLDAVGSFTMVWDGGAWDRAPGTSADGTLVNLGANNDVTVTGTVTVDTELPTAAALGDNASNPTAPAVGAFAMVWDGATWDRLPGTSADGALVNLGANNDVTVTGTVTVDTELPAAVVLADGMSNPTPPAVGGFTMGYNGATWDRVRVANTGRLQVDVVTGGGADTPTNPVVNTQTSTNVAAGAVANIDTAEAASKKLRKIDVWSSAAWKGEIFTVDNGSESTRKGVTGGAPGHSVQWLTPHRNYITLGATAGTDAFRLKFTNLDDSNAADAHVVFFYED
jgi:hypothetical protein